MAKKVNKQMTVADFVDLVTKENEQCNFKSEQLIAALKTALSKVPEKELNDVARTIWNCDFQFDDDPIETVKLPRL